MFYLFGYLYLNVFEARKQSDQELVTAYGYSHFLEQIYGLLPKVL